MRLFIPDIGDEVKLTSDWTFKLYEEHRNSGLWRALEFGRCGYSSRDNNFKEVTLPAGTVLKIDRVYIRKGVSDYSSLTFYVSAHTDKKIKGKRFWAKLNDVNLIEGEPIRNVADVLKLTWNEATNYWLDAFSKDHVFHVPYRYNSGQRKLLQATDAVTGESLFINDTNEIKTDNPINITFKKVVTASNVKKEVMFYVDIDVEVQLKKYNEVRGGRMSESKHVFVNSVKLMLHKADGELLATYSTSASIKKKAKELMKEWYGAEA